MTKTELMNWISTHEGYNNHPYIDSVGKLTIGYGRNLADNGISHEEAELMLSNDVIRCIEELSHYPWYQDKPSHVQDALVNMCFNLGINRLLGFKKMLQALLNKDYTKAALEALDSKWALQVGQRAKDVALMMRQGNE